MKKYPPLFVSTRTIFFLFFLPFLTFAQATDTSRAQASDIQAIKIKMTELIDLYELQIKMCEEAKQSISLVTSSFIQENYRELDRIKALVAQSDLKISSLEATRSELQSIIQDIQKLLRKLKRRMWFERTGYYAIIITLSIITIKHY